MVVNGTINHIYTIEPVSGHIINEMCKDRNTVCLNPTLNEFYSETAISIIILTLFEKSCSCF